MNRAQDPIIFVVYSYTINTYNKMNIQIFIFLRLNYSPKQFGNELIIPAFVDVGNAG